MRVSDFKLAEHFIESVCKKQKVSFVDVPVDFDEPSPAVPIDPLLEVAGTLHLPGADAKYDSATGIIMVSNSQSLSRTMLGIIGAYLNKLSEITGGNVSLSDPEQMALQVTAAAVIRDFMYSSGVMPQAEPKSALKVSIRQFAFVWLILRDLIAPFYRCELKDITIACGRSPKIDAAKYFGLGDGDDDVDLPMIFLNTEVESNVFRQAFLLVEAIRAHGLDATRVVADLFGNEDLKRELYGMATLAFVEGSAVADFLLTLAAAGNFENGSTALKGMMSSVWKEAQFGGGATGSVGTSWFLPALTETQLDAARGSDWSVAKRLNPLTEEIWSRVAEEKKRRGKADFTYEDLLRVHSKGMKPEPGKLLQQLLGEQRIW